MHNEKGFVRRVDELGRVVIPKELRFALKIETGTMLEFFCENNKELHLCKYEPLRQISDLGENCLHALKGHDCGILLCDSASVIAVQNLPKKDFFGLKLNAQLQKELTQNTQQFFQFETPLESKTKTYNIVLPIRSQGDLLGCIVLISDHEILDVTTASARVVANFLEEYVML